MPTTTVVKSVPFHIPCIGQEEIRAVVETLESGWITTGPKTHSFEVAFARYFGVRHAVAVNSCTAALHLSLDAMGLKEGDEVLVPTVTFTATAEVVTYFRAKPVLVDVDPVHFNMSLEDLQRKITPKTRCIIPVHFAGHPCPMDPILDFAESNNLKVIEDAAHAIPAKYRGRTIGTISSMTAFSFYATKTLATGEGGMVTTDDDALADRVRLMRLHGMSRDAWKRYSAEGNWRYEIMEAGYKCNLTDLQAALGLVQLSRCRELWRRRERIAHRYTEALASMDAYQTPTVDADVQHAWHLYVVLVDPSKLRIHRDQVIEELRERGIGTAVHFIPLHLHRYYQENWGYRAGDFPVAENYFERCISLPIYPGMTEEDVDHVIEGLEDIAEKFRR
ncbi:MAG TPA: DegT/DnrJ/EryC1/StrS family aminotransferase [Bryobacteraceae bacterium]|nr:DegT/DnrJ/EryC1/StrS family aminotransferase [Bryobacteraceae bacterium]